MGFQNGQRKTQISILFLMGYSTQLWSKWMKSLKRDSRCHLILPKSLNKIYGVKLGAVFVEEPHDHSFIHVSICIRRNSPNQCHTISYSQHHKQPNITLAPLFFKESAFQDQLRTASIFIFVNHSSSPPTPAHQQWDQLQGVSPSLQLLIWQVSYPANPDCFGHRLHQGSRG